MDPDRVQRLYKAIPVLRAQESIRLIKISDFPYTKTGARKKLIKDLQREAVPAILRGESKSLRPEDLVELING